MTRLRLGYVHEFIDVRGKLRREFRKRGHKRVKLPGLPGSTEFMDAYQAALNRSQPVVIGASRTQPGTVNEAVARYLGSVAFHDGGLAPLTQQYRRRLLDRFRVEHGEKRLRLLEPRHVAKHQSSEPQASRKQGAAKIKAQTKVANSEVQSG